MRKTVSRRPAKKYVDFSKRINLRESNEFALSEWELKQAIRNVSDEVYEKYASKMDKLIQAWESYGLIEEILNFSGDQLWHTFYTEFTIILSNTEGKLRAN